VGYEAIRKAISAHMRATGYRARKGFGHHERVARYAGAALAGAGIDEDLRAIDQLRLLRNQSQYEGLEVEPAEVEELLVHARAIVGAIGDDLRS
jgi:HEPN domain